MSGRAATATSCLRELPCFMSSVQGHRIRNEIRRGLTATDLRLAALWTYGPDATMVGRRNSRCGQRIAAWAGPLPLQSADRSTCVHAQGKISAWCFFCGNFLATPWQLMLRRVICRRRFAAKKPDAAACRSCVPHACLGFERGSPQRCPIKFMRRRRNDFSPKTPDFMT
jgi:hypothetical protein